ncbi:MAG: DUF89 family protein [Candidatus Verstraetearchaeota archaeon]|nr:DUF89 family protein [Candidatus Verstraetearchaeota archaeon]
MKLHAECIPCILTVRHREVAKFRGDSPEAVKLMAEMARMLADSADRGELATVAATRLFRFLKKQLGVEDLYAEEKKIADEKALKVAEELRSKVMERRGIDRFRLACYAALVGNALDFGVASYQVADPEKLLDEILSCKPAIDDVEEFYRLVRKGGNCLYLLDNAGEIAFDRLFIEVLRGEGVQVVALVKSRGGFQNDATKEDAERVKLDEVCKVIETGTDASSLFIEELPSDVLREVESADFMVAKGMAHFEHLPELQIGCPVIFMLKAKCRVIASLLGVPVGGYVVKLEKFA